jgi:hypothetical protein
MLMRGLLDELRPLSPSFLAVSPSCAGFGQGGLCSDPGRIVTQAA